MFEVFKVFYPTHYNLAAISILLFLWFIFLMTKKNYKWSIAVFAILMVYNFALYKRTEGKSWTITIDPPQVHTEYGTLEQPESIKMTFSVKKDWTITDSAGEKHHWCWVEDYWQKFAGTDLISKIWGTNNSKKLIKSSEDQIDAYSKD